MKEGAFKCFPNAVLLDSVYTEMYHMKIIHAFKAVGCFDLMLNFWALMNETRAANLFEHLQNLLP
jgi:hypothetical protein